jgi:WD40 repeat protein
MLATASEDATVWLWSVEGALISVLTGHSKDVVSLAWSPDGNLLASGSADGTVRLWQPDGKYVRSLDSQAGVVFGLAWSPDGSLLALGCLVSPTQNETQIWRPDGVRLKRLPTDYSGGKFYNVAWSPDGNFLVGGATDYKLWRKDGSEVFHAKACAQCTPAWGLAWSPDSQLWATGDESGVISIYDVTGKTIATLQSYCCVSSLAWTRDGQMLAGGRTVWRMDSSHAFGLTGEPFALAWSPDDRWLAAGNNDGTLRIWSNTGQVAAILEGHTAEITRVAWSPDGTRLATASSRNPDARLWLWQR